MLQFYSSNYQLMFLPGEIGKGGPPVAQNNFCKEYLDKKLY